ncbi:MAG: hypothetical protein LQ340_007558 [Diploschistes diacapsis]|nr:MAG: hypothetical protein LQ340_007558 [Diploschistes diacapsis]
MSEQIETTAPQAEDAAGSENTTFRLFMDAKASFPYPPIESKTSTATWASSARVKAALGLLTPAQQAAVCRYMRPSDSALALCSIILKRLAIMRACNLPWTESEFSQERQIRNGKPYFKRGGVEFNVSHHGEIVALVATTIPGVHVGIDVVQVDTDRDRRGLERGGSFGSWVSMFKDVFSERELDTLRGLQQASPDLSDEAVLATNFRRFYAMWALKESYIKMTGDALMAEWIRELEFPSNTPPPPLLPRPTEGWEWGQTAVTGVSIHGKLVDDARIELDTLNGDYMIATAINNTAVLPNFEQVVLSEDASSLKCCLRGKQTCSYTL